MPASARRDREERPGLAAADDDRVVVVLMGSPRAPMASPDHRRTRRAASNHRPPIRRSLRRRPESPPCLPRPLRFAQAAAWMAGWLAAMVVIAVAGREATRDAGGVPDHGDALAARPRPALAAGPRQPAASRRCGPARPGRTSRRNAVHYGAQFGWFFALTLIPLAQVVAIEFTMPIWTALLAAVFLGERIERGADRRRRARPGRRRRHRPARRSSTSIPGKLIALAAAVGFAISFILVKSLTAHRERRRDHLLDAGRAVRDRPACRRCSSGARRRRRSGPGSSSSRSAAPTRTTA